VLITPHFEDTFDRLEATTSSMLKRVQNYIQETRAKLKATPTTKFNSIFFILGHTQSLVCSSSAILEFQFAV